MTLASSVSSGCEELVEAQEKAKCAKSNRGLDTSRFGSGAAVASFTSLTSSRIVILFINIVYKLYSYEKNCPIQKLDFSY